MDNLQIHNQMAKSIDNEVPYTFSWFQNRYEAIVREAHAIAEKDLRDPSRIPSNKENDRLSNVLKELDEIRKTARDLYGLDLPNPYGEPGKGGIQ
jgi:hypothetical protein